MIRNLLRKICPTKLYRLFESRAVVYLLYLIVIFLLVAYYTELQQNLLKLQVKWKRKLNPLNAEIGRNYYFEAGENEEWEPLHKQMFFKRSSAFYIADKGMIRGLVLAKVVITEEVTCIMLLDGTRQLNVTAKFTTLTPYPTYRVYSGYTVDCVLPPTLYQKVNTIDLNFKSSLNKRLYYTKRAIDVHIKSNSNENDMSKPTGKIILCSKQYNFTLSEFNSFKIWIELNINLGYHKIVIYNNSIPFDKFSVLFEKHKNFIEVREYKYYPHLYLDDNANRLAPAGYQYHLKELSLELRRVHERIAINDCYLYYRSEVDKIAIMDYDEIVVPRMMRNIVSYTPDIRENTCHLQPTGLSNLVHYYTRLNTWYANSKTYWFRYAFFFNLDFMQYIMNSIEESLKDGKDFARVENKMFKSGLKHINFKFSNNDELEHAQNLLDQYLNLVKPKLNLLKANETRFHRVMFLASPKGNFRVGKSIHTTRNIYSVAHHHTYENGYTEVKFKHGFTSHFRTNYVFSQSEFSIKSLFFDVNYLFCFLKNLV